MKFLKIFLIFFCSTANAGFEWTSDWNLTVNKNGLNFHMTDENQLIQMPAFAQYPEDKFIESQALRSFSLSGFNDPVKVTLYASLQGIMKFDQWGLATNLSINSGINNDVLQIQRYKTIPGLYFFRFETNWDIYLNNGKYFVHAQAKPIIMPNFILTRYQNALIDSTLEFGIIKINSQPIPEKSSIISLFIGFTIWLIGFKIK